MRILVTGAAGFIGFHTTSRLLDSGHLVVGVDNLSDYYDVSLKQDRLRLLEKRENFAFYKLDLVSRGAVKSLFETTTPERVVHLAAQAGVRHSIEHPAAYVDSNLVAFANILEGCRQSSVQHLVYASSSSVYGSNTTVPFATDHNVDHPVSLYAATKKANELMAHVYSHLFDIPTTGLRFFTVYGPWARPDMAPMLFARAILEGIPINVFNYGKMERDFTYIDDVVEGIRRILDKIPTRSSDRVLQSLPSSSSSAPYKIYNIGNQRPVSLLRFIEILEGCLGKQATKNFIAMQPGDVPITYADTDDLARDVGFRPLTSIETGLTRFAEWYLSYYN